MIEMWKTGRRRLSWLVHKARERFGGGCGSWPKAHAMWAYDIISSIFKISQGQGDRGKNLLKIEHVIYERSLISLM
jgi:hypothetical protein